MKKPLITTMVALVAVVALGLWARAEAPAPSVPAPPTKATCGPDATEMVLVPAGPFQMGGGKNQNELPRHQVEVPAFYLDVTEVTFKNYLAFCQATGRRPPVPALTQNSFPEAKMYLPVTNVTWEDADAYCQAAGKRLPTEAEWEKACAGPANFVYPWGNGWNANACVNRLSADAAAAVGSRPTCMSGYGALDLSGNVWEWTADWYRAYPGCPLTFDETGKRRVVKGGTWFYSLDLLRCANRYPLAPDEATEHGGFRCAVSLEHAMEVCR